MYFRLGGGTIKGISKPGEIVWSRVFVEDGALHADIGRGTAVEPPGSRNGTPLARDDPPVADHACRLSRRDRDQMMARHRANHMKVAYADRPDGGQGPRGQGRDARRMGVTVHLCGNTPLV